MAKLCSTKEKCISEITKKLYDWEVGEDDRTRIVDYLIENKFVDELRFATAFAKDKFRYNKWGKRKISYMLKGKGIQEYDIKEAFKEIVMDDYVAMVENELRKKIRSTKAADKYQLRQKISQFAQSRGYEHEIVNNTLEDIAAEEENFDY